MSTTPTDLHAWVGTSWRPAFSLDSWDRAVRRRWPGARMQVVARGAIWWHGSTLVAECRPRHGWPPREAWVTEPTDP